ncbi:ACT domain-containing protein [Rhodoferax aquaticus]|uniref:ACT domain-containing protein n=1 Tax=Rhodoferax aquaticus TaxID=2527691 RepID=A0A515EMS4_9BURK|nr:ACT domain-containing protein [Rhodoferax aquaticus]QDL53924.1 ACT domain-containing protein [Rhodoferax aquaticus]
MTTPISNLQQLIASMQPVLNEGAYVYACVPHGTDVSGWEVAATVREHEGLTVVVPQEVAQRLGLEVLFCAAWITLHVHSDLQAVGLTAAFAAALGRANISCNVVAGAFHDHIFVPWDARVAAMAALVALQQAGCGMESAL